MGPRLEQRHLERRLHAGRGLRLRGGQVRSGVSLRGGGLERYFPGRPDISNMTPLAQYDAFLILITQPVTCTMPVTAASGTSRTLQWGAGWNNAGWSGTDGTAPEQAFACADGSYAAAYRFTDAGLERYFPGRPDISNMGPLNKYDAFLILVTAPVGCTMPIAPRTRVMHMRRHRSLRRNRNEATRLGPHGH